MAGYYSFQAIGGTVYADGDLNMDGPVNILDVVSMVNVVLNGEQNDMADLNNDGCYQYSGYHSSGKHNPGIGIK